MADYDLNLQLEGTAGGNEVQNKDPTEACNNNQQIDEAMSSTDTNDPDDDTDEENTQNDSYEVEAIIAHKKVKGVDKWRIRWFGYGPEDDTWEPRENLYGDNVLSMLNEFEGRRKEREERQKEKERIRNKDLQKKQPDDDEEKSGEDDEDLNDTNIEGWFGIKKDEGTLEQRRLFVADRRLSKTEKLLNEINASPGVRVLRNQLKDQFEEKDLSECEKQTIRKRGRPKKVEQDFIPESDLFTSGPSPVKIAANEQKKSRKKLSMKIGKQRSSNDNKLLGFDEIKPESQNKEGRKEAHDFLERKSGIEISKSKTSSNDTKNRRYELPVSMSEGAKEFGISKNLKAAFISKHMAKQEASKRSRERDEPPLEESSKLKIKKEKKQIRDGVGTKTCRNSSPEGQLKVLPEGTNIFNEIDKILEKLKLQANKYDDQKISQAYFEDLVMEGKVEQVRTILMLNSQKPFLDLNHAKNFGQTLIHRLCEIRCGVSHTQCELIDLLACNGARLDIRKSNNGQIPLHIAIANRRLCHVRKLLSLHSPVNLTDFNNKSPIMLALECSSDNDFLKFLLKSGAAFQNAYEKICKDREQRYKRQLRIITEHETRLRRALNSARDNVTLNMSVRCISPIFVNPLNEGEMTHTFNLNTQPQLPGTDYAYMVFFGVAQFLFDDQNKDSCCSIEARMWGRSPVLKTSMNERECTPLKQRNSFAFFCVPCREQNQLKIVIDPEMRQSELILLSQMVLVQFLTQQSSRTIANF